MKKLLLLALSAWVLSACATTANNAPIVTAAPEKDSIPFAPYLSNPSIVNVDQWMAATGGKFLTLAFYNSGGGCSGSWGKEDPNREQALIALANKLRAQGGQVIISTGGWNAPDIVASCEDPAQIASIYEGVLTRLKTPYLDIDPEPGDIHNNLEPKLVDRRSAALRILQDRFDRAGKPLYISYTIAIRPAFGYDAENFYVLQSAKKAGVRIDIVNPMIMDYRDGTAGPYMGVRSIMAIEKGVAQLKALFPGKKDSEYWAMTAATPMLGQNDAEPEIFTLDDARKILELAQAKGMARLSFWSLDRDNGKCSGKRVADPTCSGIEQEEWAFSKIFVQHR